MAKATAIYVRVSHRDQTHTSQLPDLERWAEGKQRVAVSTPCHSLFETSPCLDETIGCENSHCPVRLLAAGISFFLVPARQRFPQSHCNQDAPGQPEADGNGKRRGSFVVRKFHVARPSRD